MQSSCKLTFEGVLLPLAGLVVLDPAASSSDSKPEGTFEGVPTCEVELLGGVDLAGSEAVLVMAVMAGVEEGVLMIA